MGGLITNSDLCQTQGTSLNESFEMKWKIKIKTFIWHEKQTQKNKSYMPT